MIQCEFCKTEATHVIISHPLAGHSQWQSMNEMPICDACKDAISYLLMLIDENVFIRVKDIPKGE